MQEGIDVGFAHERLAWRALCGWQGPLANQLAHVVFVAVHERGNFRNGQHAAPVRPEILVLGTPAVVQCRLGRGG